MKPYVGAAGLVALLGAPAEIAVPIVRRLRRRSGVSVGPGVMNLFNGAVALAVAHYFRQHPAQWQRWLQKPRPLPTWASVTALAYLVLSPAAAACWKHGVVLRRRSPLWGGLGSPIGLLQAGLALGAFYRARGTRRGPAEPSR
jgi:non-ribosomal peptide synthetase component F